MAAAPLRHRAATALLAAAVGLAVLTGCATGSGSAPSATDPPATSPSARHATDDSGPPMTRLDAVLAEQTSIARTLVDDLVAQAPAEDWRRVSDLSDACDIALGDRSPQQWNHSRRTMTITDPAATADRLAAGLTAQGWTMTTRRPRAGETARDLQKDGFFVSIGAVDEPPVLDITATTPCVGLDGSIDRSPRT